MANFCCFDVCSAWSFQVFRVQVRIASVWLVFSDYLSVSYEYLIMNSHIKLVFPGFFWNPWQWSKNISTNWKKTLNQLLSKSQSAKLNMGLNLLQNLLQSSLHFQKWKLSLVDVSFLIRFIFKNLTQTP